MRFGTWNVRSMYRAGSLRAVGEAISKYKLDLVGVQDVRWDGSGTERAGEYTFSYGKGNENYDGRSLLLYQFTRRAIKLTSVIIGGYHYYQLHTKYYRILADSPALLGYVVDSRPELS
jgi:hypothetical protein